MQIKVCNGIEFQFDLKLKREQFYRIKSYKIKTRIEIKPKVMNKITTFFKHSVRSNEKIETKLDKKLNLMMKIK